ncbi:MAG: hypothetical protein AAF401_09645 [Pseudomonadota bacterium]
MRLLIAACLLLIALPAAAETFVFKERGLKITMPDGWVIVSAQDMAQLVEDSDFGPELKAQAQSNDPNLLVAVAEEWPAIGVAPGIQLKQYPGSVVDVDAGLNNVLSALKANARNFEVLAGPTADPLGDFAAAFVRYRYDVAVGGVNLTVEEKFWLIPNGQTYLVISSGYAPDATAQIRATVDAAAASLSRLH